MATVQYRMDRHRAFVFLRVIGICAAGQLRNKVLRELALSKQTRSAADQLREENLLELRCDGIQRTQPLERICVFQFTRQSRIRPHFRQTDAHSP